MTFRALDSAAAGETNAVAGYVEEVLQTLNDLIEYFKQPDVDLEHEEKQARLRSLIKQQDLFKEEVSRLNRSTESGFLFYLVNNVMWELKNLAASSIYWKN